jgi:myo-inositol-1(or 4)-monophosphatase
MRPSAPESFNFLLEELSKFLRDLVFEDINFQTKGDGSPVSQYDIAIENRVRELKEVYLPNFAILGEESSSWESDEGLKNFIVVDPIDGTENFVSGIPIWGVGLALYSEGELCCSCIFFPEIGMLAKTSNLTFPDASRYRPFRSSTGNSRVVGFSSNSDWKATVSQFQAENRIFGCSLFNLTLAAHGNIRFVSSPNGVRIWDIAPALAIALEFGRVVTVNGGVYNGELLDPNSKYVTTIQSQ